MMVGRTKEIAELEKLYSSKKAELVAIYGRRRVGKTYLVNECFKERFFFKHAGLAPDESTSSNQTERQLDQFYLNLMAYGLEKEERPKDWFEAFFLLRKLITQRKSGSRMVIFIDELPWMDTPGSNFIKAFEGFWNSFACGESSIMLIICGSATSWVENNLINDHSGLYGRVTYEIKLSPFSLAECEAFLKDNEVNLSRYDVTLAYMAFGGIPYYLNYIDGEHSLSQNLDNIFFKKNAKLNMEFDRLFRSVFSYSGKAKKIVEFLYTKSIGFTRAEISKGTLIPEGGTLSNYLNGLIASDFIIKYVPFGGSKREAYYKLVDPFCLFYLAFCGNAQENEDFFAQNITSPKLNAWVGYSFENVCFNHIDQIKFALGISGVSTSSSAYFSKEDSLQIDMVLSRKDNIVDLCEMKFYSDLFCLDKDGFLTINRKTNAIREKVSKKSSIRNVLITTFGLKKNEYFSSFSNVITLDNLFAF